MDADCILGRGSTVPLDDYFSFGREATGGPQSPFWGTGDYGGLRGTTGSFSCGTGDYGVIRGPLNVDCIFWRGITADYAAPYMSTLIRDRGLRGGGGGGRGGSA